MHAVRVRVRVRMYIHTCMLDSFKSAKKANNQMHNNLN